MTYYLKGPTCRVIVVSVFASSSESLNLASSLFPNIAIVFAVLHETNVITTRGSGQRLRRFLLLN